MAPARFEVDDSRKAMSPALILAGVGAYFALLLSVAWWTGRGAGSGGYFLGNRTSPWWAVALGLIGDSLSGVSYISVPGAVGRAQWHYLQVVFGYVLGYAIIIHVLLPLYYRMQLVSIYGYLGERFDATAQRTGAGFFILSRLLGAAARLYLAVNVFQIFVFDRQGVPYALTATCIIGLILAYTLHGGIKTLVWTDLLQSGFLVAGVVLSVWLLATRLHLGPAALFDTIVSSPLTTVFDWRWESATYFPKQFFSGAAIALVMTGLDQNTMQKNLSCRSLRDAQKNLYVFTGVMVAISTVILALGVLLFEFARLRGVTLPARSDDLFPLLALQHLGMAAGLVFLLGLTAATFNSADAVLTTLTTSFCLDGLRWDFSTAAAPALVARQERWRRYIHLGFGGLLLLVLLFIPQLARGFPVIDLVLKLSGYTGGPLLALFGLGLFSRVRLAGPMIPVVCVLSAAGTAGLEYWVHHSGNSYRFGFELLLLNAAACSVGLFVAARPPSSVKGLT